MLIFFREENKMIFMNIGLRKCRSDSKIGGKISAQCFHTAHLKKWHSAAKLWLVDAQSPACHPVSSIRNCTRRCLAAEPPNITDVLVALKALFTQLLYDSLKLLAQTYIESQQTQLTLIQGTLRITTGLLLFLWHKV